MTKALQKIAPSLSRDIPFNKLVLTQSNVRRVEAGVAIEQLAESIPQRRFSVPLDECGPAILATVLERYAIARIADRAAA